MSESDGTIFLIYGFIVGGVILSLMFFRSLYLFTWLLEKGIYWLSKLLPNNQSQNKTGRRKR